MSELSEIDLAIAELTNVRSAPGETVFVYGRQSFRAKQKGAATEWSLWHPWAEKPEQRRVLLVDAAIKKTRDRGSPDHLIEIPVAHAAVLELWAFVLTPEQVERMLEKQKYF